MSGPLQVRATLRSAALGRTAFSLEVDLEFGGGIHAVLGPSGSGKTTLLGVIAGRVRPAAGRVALGDRAFFHGEERTLLSAADLAIFGQLNTARSGPTPDADERVVLPLLVRNRSHFVVDVPASKVIVAVGYVFFNRIEPLVVRGNRPATKVAKLSAIFICNHTGRRWRGC